MHDRIEAEAALWATRHPVGDERADEFALWLSANPRHEGALLRAMAGLSAIEGALATNDQRPAARPLWLKRLTRRSTLAAAGGGTIAATFAGVLGWSRLGGREIVTARGEIRRLPLSDGSVATINTGSELRLLFESKGRRVELGRGQAWFQVAKDRTRPFVVDAGIAQARAVGTAFSVSRGEDGVQVAVTEGVVAVWPTASTGSMTILKAGEFATFRHPAAEPKVVVAPEQIERALSWRNGEIALENNTLGEAVAQFNRYNRQQLVLADANLANEKLVGLFKLDRPDTFAAMISVSLDVDVEVTPEQIRLSRK